MDLLKQKSKIKFLQLTDTHLFNNETSLLHDVNTCYSLKNVVKNILETELNDVDFVLLTGDISQDESVQSYEIASHILSTLQKPIFWFPGNHDDWRNSKSIFNKNLLFINVKFLDLLHWKFIFLNTKLENSDSGYLPIEELNFLEKILKKNDSSKKIVLVMHHHPIEVGTPLIDQYILTNRNELWDILSKYTTDLIICGHVHGDYSINVGNTKIETAPATCLQWRKGCTDLVVEKLGGYKIYYLNEDKYSAQAKMCR